MDILRLITAMVQLIFFLICSYQIYIEKYVVCLLKRFCLTRKLDFLWHYFIPKTCMGRIRFAGDGERYPVRHGSFRSPWRRLPGHRVIVCHHCLRHRVVQHPANRHRCHLRHQHTHRYKLEACSHSPSPALAGWNCL